MAFLIGAKGKRREFPPGGGELTRRVAAVYREAVAEYVATHQDLRLF